jgi:hypothetical protein
VPIETFTGWKFLKKISPRSARVAKTRARAPGWDMTLFVNANRMGAVGRGAEYVDCFA